MPGWIVQRYSKGCCTTRRNVLPGAIVPEEIWGSSAVTLCGATSLFSKTTSLPLAAVSVLGLKAIWAITTVLAFAGADVPWFWRYRIVTTAATARPAKRMTARIPPTLARSSTAATWRSPVATAPDHSSQVSLMLAHPPSRQAGMARLPWLAHRAAETRSTDEGPPPAGALCRVLGVQAGHGPELGGAVDVRERVVGNGDPEGLAQGRPPVAWLPLEEPVGRGRRAHVGVVPLVGGDGGLLVEGVARELLEEVLDHRRPLARHGVVGGAEHFEDRVAAAAPPRGTVPRRQQDDRVGVSLALLLPECGRRPVDGRAVAGEELVPIGHVAPHRLVPHADMLGVPEDLDHVVAGLTEQALEGELERVGARPSQPGTDDLEWHASIPHSGAWPLHQGEELLGPGRIGREAHGFPPDLAHHVQGPEAGVVLGWLVVAPLQQTEDVGVHGHQGILPFGSGFGRPRPLGRRHGRHGARARAGLGHVAAHIASGAA